MPARDASIRYGNNEYRMRDVTMLVENTNGVGINNKTCGIVISIRHANTLYQLTSVNLNKCDRLMYFIFIISFSVCPKYS